MYRLLVILSLVTITAHAQVQLSAHPNLKITAINGEAVNQSPFAPVRYDFTLPAGPTTISARYERLFDLRGDSHDYLRSQNVTISGNLSDNHSYQLTLTDNPERYSDAKEYAKKPTILLTQNGEVLASQSTSGQKRSLLTNVGALFTGNTTPPTTQNKNTLAQFVTLWQQANEEERQQIREWVQQ